MKPLCLYNCRRCPSSELLGRRTGACLTARQWVKQSMTSGARALTQCGKKRMQIPGEPILMWIFATPVCFWTVWLFDIFGKTCLWLWLCRVFHRCIRVLHFCGQVPFLYVIIVGCIHTYIRACMHACIHTYISRGAAPLCVAGVALGDIHLDYMQGLFAWQAPHSWHLVTYTLISRGTRRGTISRPWRHQLIMTIYQVWLPATGHAERVRKICGFARKSAEHYFGQRKYGEHTIALIAEPGGTRSLHTYIHDIHTYLPTYIHTYIHSYLPFYLLDLSPPPLSFLPSLSPLKPLKLILGRSWLVGLSGPLIRFLDNSFTLFHSLPSLFVHDIE